MFKFNLVRETDTPGQFIFWCVVADGSALHKLSVSVPRIVYANCTEELQQDKSMRKVSPDKTILFRVTQLIMFFFLFLGEAAFATWNATTSFVRSYS